MKTIFDKNIREQLINRINKINKENNAEWGKMNLIQMLKHNTYWNKWILGKENHKYKQAFLGKIFGKIALKKMIKDEKPFDKNIPTSDQFKVKESTGNIEYEKSEWISLIKEYEKFNNLSFIHDFFGKMTKEQIGVLVYKHTDHHLRQFGT
ncbi:hypothetical protein APS56_15665 [Pseudalgibacter alginicilyticus]|uniref:DUF1569 domain-containing protein n=1 Tax=Pseudalgibacter alginicilyticus TaxID=1736674 RepID=A0A0P0DEB6_9FLAO|nr:DUF1569 domain-containing protein [Pseudalgibacter alginicilyticus]ALJ06483.1 hypothetical protein APS56_15665 [Pseudalgibacter alginicilyticus]